MLLLSLLKEERGLDIPPQKQAATVTCQNLDICEAQWYRHMQYRKHHVIAWVLARYETGP